MRGDGWSDLDDWAVFKDRARVIVGDRGSDDQLIDLRRNAKATI